MADYQWTNGPNVRRTIDGAWVDPANDDYRAWAAVEGNVTDAAEPAPDPVPVLDVGALAAALVTKGVLAQADIEAQVGAVVELPSPPIKDPPVLEPAEPAQPIVNAPLTQIVAKIATAP